MRRALFAFAIGCFVALGTIAGLLYVLLHLPGWSFDAMRAAWKRPQ